MTCSSPVNPQIQGQPVPDRRLTFRDQRRFVRKPTALRASVDQRLASLGARAHEEKRLVQLRRLNHDPTTPSDDCSSRCSPWWPSSNPT